MPDLAITPLDDLTVLSARGPDAASFLQGQLSQDIDLLAARGALLAGLHNPQGRVLAVLQLLHLDRDHMLIVLPAELALSVLQLLTRYVLRAKVRIEDGSATWSIYGLTGPDAESAATTRLRVPMDGSGWRQMIVSPRGEALPEGETADRDEWRLADIEAGIPSIVTATSGIWIAQMLNLDRLDAISFGKGCYTGQEVIARAHYRGEVKRRMQRFHTDSTDALLPGERVELADGRRAQIVMSAPDFAGGLEFLAVTTLTAQPVSAEESSGAAERADSRLLAVTQLPLPGPR